MTEQELKLILRALAFAAHKHRDQRRKDLAASPYINHPITLADILCNEGHITDVEVICGAILHDTVEDTQTTEQELIDTFGPSIAAIVMEVTDDQTLSGPERKLRQVEHAAHASDKAKLVKLADKIANLRDIVSCPPANWPLERRQRYFDWAREVVNKVRGVHSGLEAIFDAVFLQRPKI